MMAAAPKPARERLIAVREVAEMLGMSPTWVRQHAAGRRKPVMPCVRFGMAMRFRESEVWAWVEEMKRWA